jgi:hypothetical protein
MRLAWQSRFLQKVNEPARDRAGSSISGLEMGSSSWT